MKWKLICGLPWLLLLGAILSIDFDVVEPAVIVIFMLILNVAAAPTSFAVVGAIAVVETAFGFSAGPTLDEVSLSHAIILWAIDCGLFYFQWFYLIPRCLAATRRLRSRYRLWKSGSQNA